MDVCLKRSQKYPDVNMILIDEMKITFYILDEHNLTFTVQGHLTNLQKKYMSLHSDTLYWIWVSY